MGFSDGTWFAGQFSADHGLAGCEEAFSPAPFVPPPAYESSNAVVELVGYGDGWEVGGVMCNAGPDLSVLNSTVGCGGIAPYVEMVITKNGPASYRRVGNAVTVSIPVHYTNGMTGSWLRSGDFTLQFVYSITFVGSTSWMEVQGHAGCAQVTCGPTSGTTTTTTAPPPIPSNACNDGTVINDGTISGTYLKLRTKSPSATEHWICYRVDRADPAIHKGGRLRIGGALSGTPVVDTNSAYCAAQAGNVNEVDTTTVGDTYVRVDRFDNANEAGVCVQVEETRSRVSVSKAPGLPVAHDPDPS
jgi:hypothetical protein